MSINENEEMRDGFLVTSKIKKVWKVELDLLERFINVCDKYGLRYYADSGTLLGAVRHKGMIPWDDDIDIVMFRDDYEKLLEVAEKEFHEPYFFQSAYSDYGYIRGHAQIRNSNTTGALSSELLTVPFNQGVFIDIFPIDGICDDQNAVIEQWKQLEHFRAVQYLTYRTKYSDNAVKAWAQRALQNVLKAHFKLHPFKNYFRKFENCAAKYSKPQTQYYDKILFLRKPDYQKLDKEWFGEPVMLPFEHLMIAAPKEWDKVLRAYFGDDYMTPRQDPTDHGTVIFDTETPYREYIENYRSRVKK